ncbi:MFS transporter [Enterococcus asini]|uniref:MFS transporter n=1 Tax=Enterococcus asini TaxID=57732 RepID=UPI00288F5A0B|nr:MFS transporter [Enterococcus asini]MDT2757724.1 MFS transporter [Enterococcus asini]
MYSLLLIIIYLAFISLGLPDSLLGSAWPVMQGQLAVPISYAGLVTMIISFGTIVSSLLSDRLTRRFGAGLVTACSVLLTALALFGFSVSFSFWQLCLWAIPYGLGAGAVDASLNLYVALYYPSRHMSWLHCCWGVGAAVSPYIMGHYLTQQSWQGGYRAVGVLQLALTVILFISLPLWKMGKDKSQTGTPLSKQLSFGEVFRLKGIKYVLFTFLAYCALEQTTGLWASTYLVQVRQVNPEIAARFASFFFLGITFGRFLSGFFADYLGDRQLVRLGTGILLVGIICVILPVQTDLLALAGLLIIGFGGAPIYPAIIHATPDNFGAENSQSVIGVQMATAYVGTTFLPPLFGVVVEYLSITLYPLYLLFFGVLILLASERLKKVIPQSN